MTTINPGAPCTEDIVGIPVIKRLNRTKGVPGIQHQKSRVIICGETICPVWAGPIPCSLKIVIQSGMGLLSLVPRFNPGKAAAWQDNAGRYSKNQYESKCLLSRRTSHFFVWHCKNQNIPITTAKHTGNSQKTKCQPFSLHREKSVRALTNPHAASGKGLSSIGSCSANPALLQTKTGHLWLKNKPSKLFCDRQLIIYSSKRNK